MTSAPSGSSGYIPPQPVVGTPAPQRGNRTLLYVIIGVVVVCVLCVGGAFVLTGGAILGTIGLVANAIKPIQDASDGFLNALKAEDYATAYTFIAPSAQSLYNSSADGLKSTVAAAGLVAPQTWTVSTGSIATDTSGASSTSGFSIKNDTAVINYDLKLKDGSTKKMQLGLQKIGEKWLVVAFSPLT